MISPWTIYKDQKDPLLSKDQGKKAKHSDIKHIKKFHKGQQSKSSQLTEPQSLLKPHQTPPQNFLNQYMLQSSDQNLPQPPLQNNPHISQSQQNKIHPIIPQQTKQQNEQNLSDSEELFRGLDHPQLITEQNRSKDFLKNVISDSFGNGHLDNSKLLQFCKYHSSSQFLLNEPQSPKKRKSITNLMRIESEKLNLMREWNELVLLKYIKATLRVEQAIEREVDNNIESVLEKLSQEFLPRISPQELLLEKLLKNQQEKMAKIKQGRSGNKDVTKKDNHNHDTTIERSGSKSPKRSKKQKELSNEQIMQTLQQDIEKSSIIKYLNSSESPYLQGQQSSKKTEKSHHNLSPKPKDLVNAIQISVNNAKLTEKVIYVGKKPVSNRLSNNESNQAQQNHEQSNQVDKGGNSEDNLAQNPEIEQIQKSRIKEHKENIEKLIKQHMAVRQSKKNPKSAIKQDGVQKIEVQVRKLKGKNYIVLDNSSSTISQQSNLISPRLSKSKTINLINQYPGNKNDPSKSLSKPNPQSPLLPPQFHLPTLSHRTLQPQSQKKLSSSSKLLELITNNILQQKYKSSRRNSTEDPNQSKNLIDQLFVKDKERKQMMIRRNQSVNVKNTKDILREVNKKKLLNLDEQILELKQTERLMMNQASKDIEGDNHENQRRKGKPSQVTNAMKKDFLTNDSMEEEYNFMRKKPHKLTPLETELIGLIQAGNVLDKQQINKDSVKRQNSNINSMNASGMKFSDHQIVQDMNQYSSNSKFEAK